MDETGSGDDEPAGETKPARKPRDEREKIEIRTAPMPMLGMFGNPIRESKAEGRAQDMNRPPSFKRNTRESREMN